MKKIRVLIEIDGIVSPVLFDKYDETTDQTDSTDNLAAFNLPDEMGSDELGEAVHNDLMALIRQAKK